MVLWFLVQMRRRMEVAALRPWVLSDGASNRLKSTSTRPRAKHEPPSPTCAVGFAISRAYCFGKFWMRSSLYPKPHQLSQITPNYEFFLNVELKWLSNHVIDQILVCDPQLLAHFTGLPHRPFPQPRDPSIICAPRHRHRGRPRRPNHRHRPLHRAVPRPNCVRHTCFQ